MKNQKTVLAVILGLLFILPQTACWSEDYFVRPEGGSYGQGDGSSYENAWAGFAAIDWSAISPGETLYVCGEFYDGSGLSIGASGTEGSLVEIRGDAQSLNPAYDNGFIWGGYKIEPTAWDGTFGEAWYKNGWWRHSPLAASGPIGNETLLQPVSSRDDCAITDGSFYRDTENSVIYYNPFGDTLEDFWTAFGGQGAVDFNEQSYIALRNLTLRGASGNRGVVLVNYNDPAASQHWEITGCDIGVAAYTGIYSNMGSDFGLIENNLIHDVPTGTYFIAFNGAQADNLIFRRNEVYSGTDKPGIFANTKSDRHALGGQSGDNLLFEYNYIHDWIGDGILIYITATTTSHNVTIRYNRIINLNDQADAFYHLGIGRGGTNSLDSTDRASSWRIYYNIIQNCGGDIEASPAQSDGIGIRIKSGVPAAGNTTQIYNNTVSDCNIGFLWQMDNEEDEIGFDLKNNIFYQHKAGGYHVYLAANPEITDHSHVEMDYNNYFQDGPASFRWEGGGRGDFLGFQQDALADGVIPGGSSVLLDPQLTNDLHLQTASPCIDAGVDLGLSQDITGTAVPQGLNPDIGAYESVAFLCGDVSGNGFITATDAAMAARYAIGLINLTAEQIIKADVTGNTSVSATDAAWIARKAVGLIDKFPVEEG